jgi:hypothetical protein
MKIDSKKTYLQESQKLSWLGTKALEELIGELFNEIYIQYNPERKEYHRLAVFVLNSRNKKTLSVFHLKNLVVR